MARRPAVAMSVLPSVWWNHLAKPFARTPFVFSSAVSVASPHWALTSSLNAVRTLTTPTAGNSQPKNIERWNLILHLDALEFKWTVDIQTGWAAL
jgi:hypothetical protein